jgi:hypothetical protein
MTIEYCISEQDMLTGEWMGEDVYTTSVQEARDAVARSIKLWRGEYEVMPIGAATWMFRRFHKGELIEHREIAISIV